MLAFARCHSTSPRVSEQRPASRCWRSSLLAMLVAQNARGPNGQTASTAIERRKTKTPSTANAERPVSRDAQRRAGSRQR